MLKKSLYSFILLLMPLCVWAGPIDVEVARQQAISFFNQHPSSHGDRRGVTKQQMKLLYKQCDTPEDSPLLYVFGQENGHGYIVISGDDAATSSLLGYSMSGTFNPDSIPCNLRYWLDEYARQLAFARKKHTAHNVSREKRSRESISPLITSKWHQHAPFNNLCPLDPETGDRCPAGCAATAMAQIMYYHKWPEQGVGSYSYEWSGQTLTADYGSTIYQWDKMKDTYEEDDEDMDDAVATLTYHCGVAMNTYYSTYGSSVTVNWGLEDFLSQNFKYSYSANLIEAERVENLDALIYKEISALRPVCLLGGGHAFVCDGYENGYFHFNFGWGGYGDEYYLLSAIAPESYNFSSGGVFHVIYGIKKPEKEYLSNEARFELYPDGTAHLIRGYPEGDYSVPSIIQMDGQNYEVTTIEDEAFHGCNVTSLTIPNTVTYIGYQAFAECRWLTSVSIPSSVTYIGEKALFSCELLTSIQIESGNSIYDSRQDCNAIIETASNTLIQGCKNTTIPSGVMSIADHAFEECFGLTSLTIPNSVVSIGDRAFYCCYGLTSLTIPNSVTSIGKRAFENCESLTSVNIPTGLNSLPEYAFCYCLSLASINIPNSVESIYDGAFFGCALTSLTIPQSVIHLGEAVFSDCGSLASIQVENGNTVYDSREDCNAIIETASNKLILGCKNTIIPNGVATIYDSAFRGCHDLTTVTIPGSVTFIGWCAFAQCGLKDVYCHGNVPDTDYFPFFDTNLGGSILHVPVNYIEAYQSAEYWKDFGNIVAYPVGDVNYDGGVDISDVLYTVDDVLGKIPVGFHADNADITKDGKIDISDVLSIVDIILGKGM